MIYVYIIGAIAVIVAALLFIALGMALANRYNKIAWDKYYEGMGQKNTKFVPVAVSAPAVRRKAR